MPLFSAVCRTEPLRRNLGKALRFRWRRRVNVKPTCHQLLLGESFKNVSFSSNPSIAQRLFTTMGENIPQMANGTAKGPEKGKRKLWTHPDPGSTRMAAFMRGVNQKYGLKLRSYDDLYRWSIDDIASFWGEVWDFTGITASKHYDEVRKISPSRDTTHIGPRLSPFTNSR
jgi:hypothetical protein